MRSYKSAILLFIRPTRCDLSDPNTVPASTPPRANTAYVRLGGYGTRHSSLAFAPRDARRVGQARIGKKNAVFRIGKAAGPLASHPPPSTMAGESSPYGGHDGSRSSWRVLGSRKRALEIAS